MIIYCCPESSEDEMGTTLSVCCVCVIRCRTNTGLPVFYVDPYFPVCFSFSQLYAIVCGGNRGNNIGGERVLIDIKELVVYVLYSEVATTHREIPLRYGDIRSFTSNNTGFKGVLYKRPCEITTIILWWCITISIYTRQQQTYTDIGCTVVVVMVVLVLVVDLLLLVL